MPVLDGFALVSNQSGRIEVVATAHGGHNAAEVWDGQIASDAVGFRWAQLGQPAGGALPYAPGVAQNPDGCLEAFAAGDDLAVWHAGQITPGGDWTGWHSLKRPGGKGVRSEHLGAFPPGPTPAIAKNADGTLEIFVVRSDMSVWHSRQRPEGDWPDPPDWHSLGKPGRSHDDGTMGPLAVAPNADRCLELFAVDTNLEVWHKGQREPASDSWSDWHSCGAPGNRSAGLVPTLAVNRDGRLELFTVADDSMVWHTWQGREGDWPDPPDWHSLGRHGSTFAEVTVHTNSEGCLVLFATEQESGSRLWQREQSTPGSDHWSPWLSRTSWMSLGGGGHHPRSVEEPKLALNADQRLELFLRVSEMGDMYHFVQPELSPSTSDWPGHKISF
jgi:hypothetical protein